MSTLKSQQNCLKVLGIDVGTSGIRAAIVEFNQKKPCLKYSVQVDLPLPQRNGLCSQQSPLLWTDALKTLFHKLTQHPEIHQIDQCIVDATSSTVLLCDANGTPITDAIMYDDQRAIIESERVQQVAPKNTGAHGASSTLSKVMWLESRLEDANPTHSPAHICHQVDFINHFLTGKIGITDENNALKLGYDSQNQLWPQWVQTLIKTPLPKVVAPGTEIGQILPGLAKIYGFNPNLKVLSGTTDSIAAFLAAGATHVGEAVVSLGSTLAIKVLSDHAIFAGEYGIYSHKLKSKWLVGGASNSGGAVLLNSFTVPQLETLLPQMDISHSTRLNYYPLTKPGERFPIANANLQPRLSPRPKNDVIFCQAIIEGLVKIEALCFERLSELGAPSIQQIYTCGGGVKNPVWMQLRQIHLNAPVTLAKQPDAAFGVAQLAVL